MEGVVVSQLDTEEVIKMISNVTGIESDQIQIIVKINEHGEVLQVIVFVDDEKTAKTIVKTVNGIEKEKDCKYGTLCQSKRATLITKDIKDNTISTCSHNETTMRYVIMMLLINFFLLLFMSD